MKFFGARVFAIKPHFDNIVAYKYTYNPALLGLATSVPPFSFASALLGDLYIYY